MAKGAETLRKYPRSTAKALARRREILDRAAELFDTVGYDETSVDDIALANDIGKSTLYHYFESREEMLFEMHEAFAERLLEAARESEKDNSTPAEELRSLMVAIVTLNETLPGYIRAFFENYQELSGKMRRTAMEKRNNYRKHLEGIIERGIEQGEFKPVDPSVAAYGVLGICNWTFHWFTPGGRMKGDELGAFLCDLLLRGMDAES